VHGQPHRGGVLPVYGLVGAGGAGLGGGGPALEGPRRHGGGRRLRLLPARPVIPAAAAGVADL
jgi:hypothetical protein